MGFYSFQVRAAEDVVLPEHFLILGEGTNVFNLSLDDLEAFLIKLRDHDVTVVAMYRLDEHEPLPASLVADLALSEGEGALAVSQEGTPGHHRRSCD